MLVKNEIKMEQNNSRLESHTTKQGSETRLEFLVLNLSQNIDLKFYIEL